MLLEQIAVIQLFIWLDYLIIPTGSPLEV